MDSALETTPPRLQMLVLDRTEPEHNMARFYVLSIESTLFGDAALVREWGRWGRSGRRWLDLYGDVSKAAEALEDWLVRKTRRGYRLVDDAR
jgi:predicted DNA-binding WGR domain protein